MANDPRGKPQNNPNPIDQKMRDQSGRDEQKQGHDRQDPQAQKLKGAARDTSDSDSESGRQQRSTQASADTRGQPAPGGNRGPDTGNAGQHARTHENAGNTAKQDADKSRGDQDRDENDEDRESAEISTKPQTGARQQMSRDDKR